MINAVIIDDEANCIESLKILLQEYCEGVNIVATCLSANEGLRAIERRQPDLVFLDIEMPVINGFEMLELIDSINFAVIFTTSYDKYAVKAFRFSALDYLLKPIDLHELIVAVKKVTGPKKPVSEQFRMLLSCVKSEKADFRKIAIPTIEGYELLAIDQVIRCEAAESYTYFFMKDKKRVVASRTLKEIEEQLQPYNFFVRVHHSFLVNLNEVKKYVRGEGGHLVMTDDTIVNVSRRKKDSLLKWFAKTGTD